MNLETGAVTCWGALSGTGAVTHSQIQGLSRQRGYLGIGLSTAVFRSNKWWGKRDGSR